MACGKNAINPQYRIGEDFVMGFFCAPWQHYGLPFFGAGFTGKKAHPSLGPNRASPFLLELFTKPNHAQGHENHAYKAKHLC